MNDKYKKEITQTERLALIGLMELARQSMGQVEKCDKAMADILQYEDHFDGGTQRAGILSDEYFNDRPSVDKCLKILGIKVTKTNHGKKHKNG